MAAQPRTDDRRRVLSRESLCPAPEPIRRFARRLLGCRPTRLEVRNRLADYFPHVYLTRTQPWHPEFPLDWTAPPEAGGLTRAVFVTSRAPVESELLSTEIPLQQERH